MTDKVYHIEAKLTEAEYGELVNALQTHFDITNDMSLEAIWLPTGCEAQTFTKNEIAKMREDVSHQMNRVLAIQELLFKLNIPKM